MNDVPDNSGNGQNRIFSWDRLWVPLGNPIDLGWDGNWFYRPLEGAGTRTDDLHSRSNLLILLGGPGMGKSIEVKRLKDQSTRTVLFRRAITLGPDPGATIRSTREWLRHEQADEELTLIIDGIDEALPHNRLLLHTLAGFLEGVVSPKLKVILCLRSGAWDGTQHGDLIRAWNTNEAASVFEICPLRHEDAEVAFREITGEAPEGFVEWLHTKKLGPLARTPIHFREIVRIWQEDPTRDVSVHGLRERQISLLLKEDPARSALPGPHSRLTADKAWSLAEMVAIHALLSGRLSVALQPSESEETLALLDFLEAPLAGRWKIGSETIEFGEVDLRSLVDRALFLRVSQPGEAPRFSFVHHTFAEHLAGRCLARQPTERLLRVLGGNPESGIPPQMKGAAAMLAPSNDRLRDWLLDHDPEVLLRSDGLQYAPELRANVINRVLITIEEADDNRRLEPGQIDSGFACAEASAVLSRRISDPKFKELTRIAALNIAGRCPDGGTESALWQLITKDNEPTFLRSKAVDAWLLVASRELDKQRDKIWMVARGDAGPGKAHDRPDALHVLLNAGEQVSAILASMPAKDESLIGSLDLLEDHYLPRRITVNDLPECLSYLSKVGTGRIRGYSEHSLAATTYRLVLQNLDLPNVLVAFASHWWHMAMLFHLHLENELKEQIDVLPLNLRRELVIALINAEECFDRHFEWHLPLEESPLDWVLSQLPDQSSDRRKRWLQLVASLWYGATRSSVSEALADAYRQQGSDFQDLFPPVRAGRTFEETIQRHHRAQELRQQRRRRFFERLRPQPRPRRKPRPELTRSIERELTTNPIQGWRRLAWLAWDDEHGILNTDKSILDSPGWKALAEDAQNVAHAAAREFLLTQSAPHESGRWSDLEEGGYRAIDLLSSEIGREPELERAVREKWTEAVLRHPNSDEDHHQKLVQLLRQWAPEQVRRWMVCTLTQALDSQSRSLDLRTCVGAWDVGLSREMMSILADRLYGRKRFLDLSRAPKSYRKDLLPIREDMTKIAKEEEAFAFAFYFLVDVDPEAAKRFVLQLALISRPESQSAHPAVSMLLLQGIVRFPEVWEQGWGALHRYPWNTSRRALLKLAVTLGQDCPRNKWIIGLTVLQVFQLYSFYCLLFPLSSEHEPRSDTMTQRDHIDDFERAIWERLAGAGAASEIDSLIKQAACDRRRRILRWYLRDARQNAARLQWQPLSPREVSGLMATQDALLVRNSSELREAVLASLSRYQDRLRLRGRVLLDCWEQQSGKSRYRPIHEENLSARLEDFLLEDLRRVIVAREQELRLGVRRGRTDIMISAFFGNQRLEVIIEHKRAQNPEVNTGIREQLVSRYLEPSGCPAGIFLVSWFDGFDCDTSKSRNALGADSPDSARALLEEEARKASQESGYEISVFLLDCLPQVPLSNGT